MNAKDIDDKNHVNLIVLEEQKKQKRMKKSNAVKLRDRSLTKFEVTNLFEDVFTPDQRETVSDIIKILGRYMLLETDQLFQIYERMAKKKLKLNYIKIAVKFNLIGEYKYESTIDGEKDIFFYSSKLSGRIFLNIIGFDYNRLSLDTDTSLRRRILILNRYLIDNRYLMLSRGIMSHYNGFYEVLDRDRRSVICYFGELCSEYEAIMYMLNYMNRKKGLDDEKVTKEEVLDKYRFEVIESVVEDFYYGNLTIATPYTYIYSEDVE